MLLQEERAWAEHSSPEVTEKRLLQVEGISGVGRDQLKELRGKKCGKMGPEVNGMEKDRDGGTARSDFHQSCLPLPITSWLTCLHAQGRAGNNQRGFLAHLNVHSSDSLSHLQPQLR